MSKLHSLIQRRIKDLTGAEFKLAVYLYCRLEHQLEITTTVAELAQATGLSWRQTQSALRSLDKKAVLRVDSRRHNGTCCSLPPELVQQKKHQSPSRVARRSVAAETAPPPPNQPRLAPSDTLRSIPPVVIPVREERQASPPPQPDSEREIQQLVRTLLDRRNPISAREIQTLLVHADGDGDRLLRRLRKLDRQNRRYDEFLELCSEIRRMVLVR